MTIPKSRIGILDGFRAVAILSVMFFHFFSRWTPPTNSVSLYPYAGAYNYFELGSLGVQFFYIISGFVIYFTLENTYNFRTFWKKRLIRLVPSMAVASIIIFTICRLFDSSNVFPNSHRLANFIPSITFIDPQILRFIFIKLNIDSFTKNLAYISGSYWTLWQEIQFYIYSSFIYFINIQKFKRNFLFISIALISIDHTILYLTTCKGLIFNFPPEFLRAYLKLNKSGLSLIPHLPFFSIGVLFYILFRDKRNKSRTSLPVKIAFWILLIFIAHSDDVWTTKMVYFGMVAAFLVFIYFPDKLSFFENSILAGIGECSYFLYLIHENTGVLIINSLGKHFLYLGPIFPLGVILLLILISIFYTKRLEFKISNWLKKQLLRE